jgi:hypothetical protein
MIPRLTDETPVSFARQRHRTRDLGRPHDGAQRVCCNAEFGRFSTGRMVSFGSQPEELNVSITSLLIPRKLTSQRTCADFRFVPIATERSATKKLYSITSSAIESTSGGIVRPSALAVFMLMTSSNLLDCTTGRSAGIAPFKTLAA